MFAPGYQGYRIVAPPHADAVPPHQVIHRSGRCDDDDADIEFCYFRRFEQAADTFEDDDASGNDNQQSFDRGGNQLDLAMSERMPRILRLGGQIQAVQANEACRYVHNTLHRIGQDTDRIGQPESEEFAGHDGDRPADDPTLDPLLERIFVYHTVRTNWVPKKFAILKHVQRQGKRVPRSQ